ncbi:MAG TPA: phosphatase PAP2 family protein [Bacteroidales bacterium]|nr:phosphatase PAP2 family protein [Bacteroidales bacterium]HPT11709.1 phosphatase PAP2 family protein [Bacteroidales bacterium]
MVELDRNLLLYLNSFHSPFWDSVMVFITGKLEWIPLYLFIIWLFWRKYRGKVWIPILIAVLGLLLSDQISVLIKNSVQRLRPGRDPSLIGLVHLVNNYRGGMYGFVSSHAANTFAFAALSASILRNKWYTLFLFVWASVVSYSRIYLGVHFPGDVVCGAILGLMVGYGLYFGFRKILEKNAATAGEGKKQA